MNTNENLQDPQSGSNSRSPVDLAYIAKQASRAIFVRSDSILTDDDYVPFDAPAQSKFGPISRMSNAKSAFATNKIDEALGTQSFFNDSTNQMRLSAENLNAPNVTTTSTTTQSNDASVWLYNNLQQKSPNYNYQSNDLPPIKSMYQQSHPRGISSDTLLNENLAREGKIVDLIFFFFWLFANRILDVFFLFLVVLYRIRWYRQRRR